MRLLLFLACAIALAGICWLWVQRDHAEIKQATGKKNLLSKFHRQGLLWKMLSVLPLPIVFALLGFGLSWKALLAFAAFSLYAISFWWYFFDRWLNVERGLSRWYFGKSNSLDLWLRKQAAKYGLKNQHLINRVKLPLLLLASCICLVIVYS
ncbi:hypothetical protein C8N40_111134 [Pontibacter mucosus]|uniref:Uncharacterized protein n=1 Tax=Pontibacter mucosus TaxID=1649266 RepID=A0A2T5YD69_9BACT|nr:hypothetical protein [Pontibacter mucosus]PTX14469.1 hypothetical protein C8N40_111134 [Pontibacter mucosus]